MFFHTFRIYQNVINEYHENWFNTGMKTEFIRYMKCAGAFVNPNDMTRYSYKPYLIVKVVLGISSA
jgi:hypothetical protein